jgi:hypothetical protein
MEERIEQTATRVAGAAAVLRGLARSSSDQAALHFIADQLEEAARELDAAVDR